MPSSALALPAAQNTFCNLPSHHQLSVSPSGVLNEGKRDKTETVGRAEVAVRALRGLRGSRWPQTQRGDKRGLSN